MEKIIERLAGDPRKLFAVDASGALLSALFTAIIAWRFQQYIGLPAAVLKMLVIIAFILCTYSAACFLFAKHHWRAFIIAIAIANLLYCMLTLCLLGINYSSLTVTGIGYFSAEIIIISLLICLEFKVWTALYKR